MARKPAQKMTSEKMTSEKMPGEKSPGEKTPDRKRASRKQPRQRETRAAVVDAALELAAERPWEDVRLTDIAATVGISLSELRAEFDGKMDILAAFSRRIDQAVLDRIDEDLADEPPRERLFDVLMTRFDVLAPYREAVRSIARGFQRRPGDLVSWNPVAVRSMAWMMEAAGIDTGGRLGAVATQGLAVAFGRTVRVWLRDDDEGMARTMVALDRRLNEGERWMRRLDRLTRIAGAVDRMRRAGRRRRGYDAPETGEEVSGSGI